ncbi:MaoC family dehydratase N-terminal domain-containing protein [Hydrogenophaga sp. 2FB]|uniref:MaoC family dehydratase N-terminal domain-containing protein n=1 Tax=Hydrogenophaga sp. 2FB TaxID=2502187 RepID=UPI0010F70646|nr:MaoC family dehydratase N-terminal domain-containing protein [Hydrogenophaga sp. 2FB]
MLDKTRIGMTLPLFSRTAEAGQLRFFAKATGETNAIYFDEATARAAGHPGLPLPPTFLLSLEITRPSSEWRREIGMDPARVLHGEQSFTYHRTAYAGDELCFESRIADIYDKKDGALDFLVRETRVTNQRGEHVADLRSVTVQRNR